MIIKTYYFDDINKFEVFDFHNIYIDEISHKKIFYDISCKALIVAKYLLIRFDKVNGFIRDYGWTKYLVLLGLDKYDTTYNRIKYLRGVKSSITYVFSYHFGKIKILSGNDSHVKKTLTVHNVIVHMMPAPNKDQNH